MRLLITGGTGFFGRAMLRYMSSDQIDSRIKIYNEVIVLTRSPEKFSEGFPELASLPWLKLCQGDISNPSSLRHLQDLGQIDHVIHAATDSTDSAGLSALQQLDQIVTGTRNVLELSKKVNCKRFLLTSSGGVYGPQPPDMEAIPETYLGCPDPLLSTSTYGLGKRLAEHLCSIYARQAQMEIVIARCFAFVGEDLPLDAHFAIGNFIRDALHRPSIEVGGDGTPVRTYMDQRDLASWLMVLLANGRSGQAYNVGSDAAITIRDLAYFVRNILAPQIPVNIADETTGMNFRNRYVPSIAKAKTELQLTLKYSLEDSILKSAVPRLM